jgi:hypothetical protein
VKVAELRVAVVEQLDTERLAYVRAGPGDPEPRRCGFVPGHDQMMVGGEFLDLFDRDRVRAMFGTQLIRVMYWRPSGLLASSADKSGSCFTRRTPTVSSIHLFGWSCASPPSSAANDAGC